MLDNQSIIVSLMFVLLVGTNCSHPTAQSVQPTAHSVQLASVPDESSDLLEKIEVKIAQELSFDFVRIPPGVFRMGYDMPLLARHPMTSSSDGNASPEFIATITKGYYFGNDNINCSQYAEFLNTVDNEDISGYIDISDQNPNRQFEIKPDRKYIPKRSGTPVNVSWIGAERYCRWLSEVTKMKFRLPTEAEWELAFRGPSNSHEPGYDDLNYGRRGIILPNGVVNMTGPSNTKVKFFGNWVNDYFDRFSGSAKIDPQGPPFPVHQFNLEGDKEARVLKCPVESGRICSGRVNAYSAKDNAGIYGFRIVLDEECVKTYLENTAAFPKEVVIAYPCPTFIHGVKNADPDAEIGAEKDESPDEKPNGNDKTEK